MADAPDIPEDVPVWFRRYLETQTAAGGTDPPAPPPPPVVPPPDVAPLQRAGNFSRICKEFSHLGGKEFRGTETYVEARDWLRDTEEIMDLLEMEDIRRVRLAAWHLKGEAKFWWETVVRAGMPWHEFLDRFERKFLSRAESDVQIERFIQLKQESMSVREYIRMFGELSRFAPEMVDTRRKKAVRFVRGLSEPLQSMLATHIPMEASFEALVEMALSYAGNKKEEPKEKVKEDSSEKKQWHPKKKQLKNGGSSSTTLGVHQGQINKEVRCYRCGVKGHYPKECKGPDLRGKCYICAQPGHLAKDCP